MDSGDDELKSGFSNGYWHFRYLHLFNRLSIISLSIMNKYVQLVFLQFAIPLLNPSDFFPQLVCLIC